MKKIISSILVILTVVLTFCGCNSSENKNSSSDSSSSNNADSTQSKTQSKHHTPQIYTQFGDFNEGLAWVKYGEEPKEYWGCIDKNGKMLFSFNRDVMEEANYLVSPVYENGYTYFRDDKFSTIIVIDKNGKICGEYENCVAYGYGYTVVENHISDFDSANYEYTIYRPDGSEAKKYTTKEDSKIEVSYCRDGAFFFKVSTEESYFFFSKNEKWVKYEYNRSSVDKAIEFNNGLAFTVNDSYSSSKSYVLIDSEGKITELNNDDGKLGGKRENSLIYGDTIVFYIYSDYGQQLYSYNIKTKSVTNFEDTSVLEKLDHHYIGSYSNSNVEINLSFNEEGFLIPLIGADNIKYATIIDYNMNMMMEPVYASSYEAYSNGTCSIDSTIYDMKGNKLFSLSDIGYEKVIAESDDILIVSGCEDDLNVDKDIYQEGGSTKHNFAAIDKEGNVLFESIDMSGIDTE